MKLKDKEEEEENRKILIDGYRTQSASKSCKFYEIAKFLNELTSISELWFKCIKVAENSKFQCDFRFNDRKAFKRYSKSHSNRLVLSEKQIIFSTLIVS